MQLGDKIKVFLENFNGNDIEEQTAKEALEELNTIKELLNLFNKIIQAHNYFTLSIYTEERCLNAELELISNKLRKLNLNQYEEKETVNDIL